MANESEDPVPQMRDYYGMATVSHPFLMYFHELNFRSNSVNTDGYGLRLSADPAGRLVTLDDVEGRDCSLFVGGSTAFGVGATDDRCSIPSLLAKQTGETWLNFSGRSFSSTQEFLLFSLYRHRLGRIKKVVLFSGFNNLTIYAVSKLFPTNLGGFYYWSDSRRALPDPYLSGFQKWLRSRFLDRIGDTVRWRKKGWQDLLRYQFGDAKPGHESDECGSLYERIDDKYEQKDAVLVSQRRDLQNWAAMAKAHGFSLSFVLQPFALWADRKPIAAEERIFEKSARVPRPQFDFLGGPHGRDIYRWWQDQLKAMCGDLDIGFHNANEAIEAAPPAEWIWVDRAHLTDAANGILARWITARV